MGSLNKIFFREDETLVIDSEYASGPSHPLSHHIPYRKTDFISKTLNLWQISHCLIRDRFYLHNDSPHFFYSSEISIVIKQGIRCWNSYTLTGTRLYLENLVKHLLWLVNYVIFLLKPPITCKYTLILIICRKT